MPNPLTAWTPEKKQKFLDTLKSTCNVTRSAAMAGVSRTTVYQTLKHDEEFKQEFDEARQVALDALEDEIVRRAYEGIDKPIFYQGEQVSVVKEYSDTLAMFYLKGQRPEKYRDNVHISARVDLFANFDIHQLIEIAQMGVEPTQIKTIEPELIEHRPGDE